MCTWRVNSSFEDILGVWDGEELDIGCALLTHVRYVTSFVSRQDVRSGMDVVLTCFCFIQYLGSGYAEPELQVPTRMRICKVLGMCGAFWYILSNL